MLDVIRLFRLQFIVLQLSLILPVLSQGGDLPTPVVAQNQYSVLIGNNVTLVCTVTSNIENIEKIGDILVSWQFIRNGENTTIDVLNDNNKYGGSTINVPSLTIFNAAYSDQGDYICRATNQFGTGISQTTTLTVTGNIPSVAIQQSQYSVLLGNSVTLVCSVTANPSITSVFWQRDLYHEIFITIDTSNNKYSGSTVTTPSLTIHNAGQADEGLYVCFAINSIGTGQSSMTFLSVFEGIIPTVVITNASYTVNIGNTVTLGCLVSANPTETNVYWIKTQNGVSTTISVGTGQTKYSGSTVQSPSLQIFNVDQSDQADYVCYATNSLGTGNSAASTLNVLGNIPIVRVLESQYSVNIGNSSTLGCTVTANPVHTTVYWQRIVGGVSSHITMDNVKYSGSTVGTPSLTINNAANSDEGYYVCFATNSIGTGQSANTYLDVVGKWNSVQCNQPYFARKYV